MKFNKKILISIGIIFSIIIFGIAVMKISISILYPENVLTNFLKSSFKDICGKAIKFDTVSANFYGNIIIENFCLSNSDDFNDNINLIKSDKIIIYTSFLDLIRKKITFTGISMVKPKITITKNFGKTYSEVFIDDIVNTINKDKINEYIIDNFRFELIDSTLSFTEVFKNSKSVLDFYNLDIKLQYNGEYITYKSNGNIRDIARDSWFKCSYNSNGKIYLDKKYYDAKLEIKNFDLSYFTNLLNDIFDYKAQALGVFDGKFNIISNDDIVTCYGKMNIASLNLFYFIQDHQYPLFKEENIKSEININFSQEFDKFTIDKLEINNGPIQLSSTFDYSKDNLLSIEINSNKVDLSKLSETVHFFRDCTYDGEAYINGKCVYSFKDKKPENVKLNLTIDKFNIIPLLKEDLKEDLKENLKEDSHELSNIKNGYLLLTADKDNISLESKFVSDNSDIDIRYNGLILNYEPVKSSNMIEINSKNLQLNFLKEIVLNSIRKIYSLAYLDVFQNFDVQKNFLTEPAGIFINNNDFTLKLHANRLYVAGKSHLDNLDMTQSLIKGVLKTNTFSVEGYNGIYKLDFYSYLRQSYPFFRIKAEFSELDLNAISEDAKLDYSFGGNLSVDINFEASAYRVGQIIENARAGIDISIKDGYINNLPLQNKLNEFLNQNNVKDTLNRRIDFNRFSFNFTQASRSYYIKNFSFQSPYIYFNTYGNYSMEDGLIIPASLNISRDNKTEKIPFEILGNLESPCVKVRQAADNPEQQSLCF